jgi:hypothetical protein
MKEKKQQESKTNYEQALKKLRESGLQVEDKTEDGSMFGFIGGVRRPSSPWRSEWCVGFGFPEPVVNAFMKERPASEGRSQMWLGLRSAALCFLGKNDSLTKLLIGNQQ